MKTFTKHNVFNSLKVLREQVFKFCSNENRIIFKPDVLSNDLETAKKQVYWRIRNIGQRELEMLIGDWWEANKTKLNINQLIEFNKEVLEMENPDMNKYFVKLDPPSDNMFYTKKILNI